MRRAISTLLVGLGLTACGNDSDREPEVLCQDIGYAISSRAAACFGSAERANALYASLFATYTCAGNNSDFNYACVIALNRVPCATATTYGDDLTRWLAHDNTCGGVFQLAGPMP